MQIQTEADNRISGRRLASSRRRALQPHDQLQVYGIPYVYTSLVVNGFAA